VARSFEGRKLIVAAGVLAAFLLALSPVPAGAASYPAGGSTFSGSAEGWKVNSATCNVPVLCTASGGYDGTAGKPAGSLAASSSILLNLGGAFKSIVVEESPAFKVTDGGAASLRLDRQFLPGGLLPLTPQVKYTVSLLDKTAGTEAQPLTETVTAESAFTGKEGAATLVEGHTYAIRIESEIDSTVAGVGVLGTTTVRFDNVVLAPAPSSSGKPGGGSTSSGVPLASLMRASLVGPVVMKGKRLIVRAKCPAAVGTSCRLSLRGLLSRKKAATASRAGKVAQGKTRRFVLRVKPRARPKVASRKRLLFRQGVRAGGARATVFKSLKLVHR
jgi:hypothetical protein